ncbi:hypothetical protein [Polycladidibacter hongkongensis]|uniref:hypothetical protein n=1 Tax=Polycladidibacter hongkongensis TaxID=1647556 RepID=UPI000829A272|nr:hypothetical protein [Pseudovibrio hongkongensis]
MAHIKLSIDDNKLTEFWKVAERLGSKAEAERAYRAAINRTGTRLRNAVIKTLPKQTGLEKKTIKKALGKAKRAYASHNGKSARLEYTLITNGGYISLRHFKAKEYKWGGVGAKPRGRLEKHPQAWIKGGRFPNRKDMPQFKGAVFQARTSGKRWWGHSGFRKVRSDVRIPEEMTIGESAKAFERESSSLKREVEFEVRKRLLKR